MPVIFIYLHYTLIFLKLLYLIWTVYFFTTFYLICCFAFCEELCNCILRSAIKLYLLEKHKNTLFEVTNSS